MTKQRLIALGWTPESLRERLKGCRAGIREVQPNSAQWTYRMLFASLYRQYKHWLTILESKTP